MNPLRRLLCLAALPLAASALPTPVSAQAPAWPSRPITFIVPYAAGGLTDQVARETGAHLSKALGQPVVVENRPGGGAQIAMNALKQAPADGHTVFIGDVPSLATNVGLFSKLSYDPRTDVQPVAQLIVSPGLVVVPVNSPFKSFSDLVEGAKTKSGGLTYATQGVGTGGHLFSTLLAQRIGRPMTAVAFRGSIPGLTDTMSGQVDFMYDAIPTAVNFVKAGKLRALAIGAEQRSPMMPEIPTLKELGYEAIVPTFWWGVAVKAGTPPALVDRLHAAFVAAINDPAISKKFVEQGVVITTSTPARFTAYIDSEITRWTKVMRDAGMSAD